MIKLLKNQKGTTAIEYAVIAAGVSVVIITAASFMGEKNAENFNDVATKLDNAFNPASGGVEE